MAKPKTIKPFGFGDSNHHRGKVATMEHCTSSLGQAQSHLLRCQYYYLRTLKSVTVATTTTATATATTTTHPR
eukprot:3140604-Amphidinium_carterae.1